jgi:hypothetical protein
VREIEDAPTKRFEFIATAAIIVMTFPRCGVHGIAVRFCSNTLVRPSRIDVIGAIPRIDAELRLG